MIDTEDKKKDLEEDLSDNLFSHGTVERQRSFLEFFTVSRRESPGFQSGDERRVPV